MEKLLIHQKKTTAYSGPPRHSERCGTFMACPKGEFHCTITRAWDPRRRDYYVEATCPCSPPQRIYDGEREAIADMPPGTKYAVQRITRQLVLSGAIE